MKNDDKIKNLMQTLYTQTKDFLDYTSDLDQCAYTDRLVEDVLKTAEQLKNVYNSNFDNN